MENSKCSICLENLNKETFKLSCDHSFHTSCIIEWFRFGNESCPGCRDISVNIYPRCVPLKTLISECKKSKTQLNKELSKLISKYENVQKETRSQKSEFCKWKKSKDGYMFRNLLKVYNKFRSIQFSSIRKIRKIEQKIQFHNFRPCYKSKPVVVNITVRRYSTRQNP